MYNLRDKWCTALSNDFFLAGILSSQRSEFTNSAIGFEATKSTSPYQFFKVFHKTIERWREREIALDLTGQPQPQRLHLNLLVYYDTHLMCTSMFL